MQRIGLLFPPTEAAAALVIGGITILERQARQLQRAGVDRLVLVDPVPLTVLPAGVEILSAEALPALLTPDTQVVTLAAGLVVDERAIAALALHPAPVLLVSAGSAPAIERLDAQSLYAGIAVLPGALVARVAAGLGEWDLASTLIRAAAAEPETNRVDIAGLPLYDPARRRDVPMLWARPEDDSSGRATTDAIIAGAQKGCLDWPARFIHPWPENMLVRLLAPTRVTPNMVTLATGFVGAAAGLAFACGWLWTGLILALITGPLDGVDGKLARTRVEYSKWGDLEHLLDKLLEYGWYLALAWHFAGARDSALPWAVAALIILPAVAEAIQGEFFRRMTGIQLDDAGVLERRIRLVAGRRNTFLWTFAGFAAAGLWFQGFVMLAAYSVITTAVAQWRFYVRLSAYGRSHGTQIAANYAATSYAFLPPDRL